MPYTADSVPSYVPKKKAAQWAAIFNSALKDGDSEEQAFRKASGAIKAYQEKGYIYDTWDVEQRQYAKVNANYNPVGGMGSGDRACANCRWFVPSRDACVVVSGDIVATGLSDLYAPIVPVVQEPIPVTIVAGSTPVEVKSIAQSLPVVGKLFGNGESYDSPIILFKDNTGQMRFFCHPSNCFRDREFEILTSEAHKEYVQWVTDNPQYYPELQLWHVPATKCGKVDWIDYADDFLCASGVVYKDWEAVVTKAVQMGAGMSHGFIPVHSKSDARDVEAYRSFEFTILPVAHAANALTDIDLLNWSEKDMGFTPVKRKYFSDLGLSEEQITGLEASTKQLSEKAKSLGIEFKDNTETDEAASLVPQITALTEAVTAMAGAVQSLSATSAEQAKELAETKELATKASTNLNSAVEQQFTARVDGQPQGFVASASDGNINKEATKEVASGNAAADELPFFNLIGQQALRPYAPNGAAGSN
jgi:hypothetical protein